MTDDRKAFFAVIAVYGALYGCLRLGFPEAIAILLAGVATWSLCVLVLAAGDLRLAYRYGVFKGSIFALVAAPLGGARLISGDNSVASFAIVFLILLLGGLAVNMLVQRGMFTAAERNEAKRTQVRHPLRDGMQT